MSTITKYSYLDTILYENPTASCLRGSAILNASFVSYTLDTKYYQCNTFLKVSWMDFGVGLNSETEQIQIIIFVIYAYNNLTHF